MYNSHRLDLEDREKLAERLKKQAILLSNGRLLQILINIFAERKYIEKLKKREGQEIQLNFPAYDTEPNCLTFVLSETPSDPVLKPSENPKVTIIFNVPEQEVNLMLIDIVSTKYNIFGILKLLGKYLLTKKIQFKPKSAMGALIATLKCFLIGNNEIFTKKRGQ